MKLMVCAFSTLPLLFIVGVHAQAPATQLRECSLGSAPVVIDDARGVEFGAISGIAFESDTVFAVGDRLARSVRFFTVTGRLAATHGRQGSGPGEFEAVGAVRRAGDTIVVQDHRLRRLSLMTSAGGFVRTAEAPATLERLLGILPGGAMVVTSPNGAIGGQSGPEMTLRPPFEVRLHAADGNSKVITTAPGGAVLSDFSRAFSLVTAPFRPAAVLAATSQHVVVGDGSQTLRRVGYDGRSLGTIELPLTRVPVTRTMLGQWIEHHLAGSRPENHATLRSMFAVAELPSHTPSHGSIQADERGVIWVQEYRAPNDARPARIVALDTAGTLQLDEVLPGRLTLMAVSPAAIVFVARDELDVEGVVVYHVDCLSSMGRQPQRPA